MDETNYELWGIYVFIKSTPRYTNKTFPGEYENEATKHARMQKRQVSWGKRRKNRSFFFELEKERQKKIEICDWKKLINDVGKQKLKRVDD